MVVLLMAGLGLFFLVTITMAWTVTRTQATEARLTRLEMRHREVLHLVADLALSPRTDPTIQVRVRDVLLQNGERELAERFRFGRLGDALESATESSGTS